MKKFLCIVSCLFCGIITFADTKKAQEYFQAAQNFDKEDNIFYALANYYDAMMEDSENADYRSAFFTYKKDLETGKPGKGTYSEFDTHDRWLQIYYDYIKYFNDNCPFSLSVIPLTKGKLNYEERTTEYTFAYFAGNDTNKFIQLTRILGTGMRNAKMQDFCPINAGPEFASMYFSAIYNKYKEDFLWDSGNISYFNGSHSFKKMQPQVISESSNGFPSCFSNFSWRAEFSFVNKEGDTVIPFEKFIPENLSFSVAAVYENEFPVFFRHCDSGIYYNTYKISLTEEEVKKYQPETLTPVITKLDLVGFAVNADKYIPDREYLVEGFEPLQKQLDKLDHYTPLNQKMISPDEDKAQTELFHKLLYIDNLMQYEKDAELMTFVKRLYDSRTYIETDTENKSIIKISDEDMEFVNKRIKLPILADLFNRISGNELCYTIDGSVIKEAAGYKVYYYSHNNVYYHFSNISFIKQLSEEESNARIAARLKKEEDARIAKEQAAFRAEQERLNTIQYYEDIIVEKLSKIGITLELTDEITYKSEPDNKIRVYKIIPDRKTVARQGKFKSKAYLLVAENYSLSNLILSVKETAEFFNNYDKKYLFFNYYDGYYFCECDGIKLPKDW